jgi:hypothetical protein
MNDATSGPRTGGFDLMLQFSDELIDDLVKRQLTDPLTTNPHSPGFIPRRILRNRLQDAIPLGLDWDIPSVSCGDDGLLSVSVHVEGGFCPPRIARNLTLSADAMMTAGAVIAANDEGVPYLTIDQRSPGAAGALELGNPHVGYAMAAVPVPLPQAEISSVISPLHPIIASAVLDALRHVHLSYALESLPLRKEAASGKTPASPGFAYRHTTMGVRVLSQPHDGALALASDLGERSGEPMHIQSVLNSAAAQANASVTITSAGMAHLLDHLRASGKLPTLGRSDGAAQTGQHWDTLACTFRQGSLVLAGQLSDGTETPSTYTVETELTCTLDEQGEPVIEPRDAALPPTNSVLVVNTWRTILQQLFRVANVRQGEAGLWQRFTVPGSRVAVEAKAIELQIADDELTLFYQVPLKRDGIQLSRPALTALPVTVTQRAIPVQSAPGAPVEASVVAEVVGEHITPIEYAWTGDAPLVANHEHVEITATPLNASDGALHSLAQVEVRAADLLGRTGQATATIRYQAAHSKRQPPRGRNLARRVVMAGLGAVVLLGAIGGGVLARSHVPWPPFGPSARSTPTGARSFSGGSVVHVQVSVNSSTACRAIPSADAIPGPASSSFPMTILNSSTSTSSADWSLLVSDQVPGTTDPWATASTTFGTINVGDYTQVQITSSPALCAHLALESTFHIIVAWTAGDGGRIDVPITVQPPAWPSPAINGLAGAIGSRYIPSQDRLIFVEFDSGNLSSIDYLSTNPVYHVLGTGYANPEDVAVTADGKTAYVTERNGAFLKVDLANPNRAQAIELVTGLVTAHQIVLDENDQVAYFVDQGPCGVLGSGENPVHLQGGIVSVDLKSNTAHPCIHVGPDFQTRPIGLAMTSDFHTAYVTLQLSAPPFYCLLPCLTPTPTPTPDTGEVVRVDMSSPQSATVIAQSSNAPLFYLTWADAQQTSLFVTERDPANAVWKVDVTGGSTGLQSVASNVPSRPSSTALIGNRLYVCSNSTVTQYTLGT